MGRLDNKVAIVTGAGSGIGKATALLFAREGACVLAADVTGAEKETAHEIGEGALAVHVDVSKAAEVEAIIASIAARFGRLDVIFNNAGIEGAQGTTADYTEENFDRVIAVNVKHLLLGMKYAIPARSSTPHPSPASWASRTSPPIAPPKARSSSSRRRPPSSTPRKTFA